MPSSAIWRSFWPFLEDPGNHAQYLEPGPQRTRRLVKIIDSGGFNKRVFFVAFSGFLASSYSLFATNVIKPAWYYVYPPCGRLNSDAGLVIDEVTLVGTAVGMLLAGHFADLWGRKKLYGFELAILIVATLGVMQSSEGFMVNNPDGSYRHSMSFYAWITWWRFVLGIGIGAEYPLTAVITAEWASTKSRGRMLASVFAMQAVARLLAPLIGFAALRIASARNGLSPDTPDDDNTKMVVDQVWRTVTGIAIVPAAFAVVLRLTIPETPRYFADILEDIDKAIEKALKIYPQQISYQASEPKRSKARKQIAWYKCAATYLRKTRAGRDLAVISLLWLIMDVAWYGLSMESPSALATLWHDPSLSLAPGVSSDTKRSLEETCAELNNWRTDRDNANATISRVLEHNAVRSMLVVSIGSLLGNIALICMINRFRRKWIMTTAFLLLSLLFAITGGTLISTYNAGQSHRVTTVFFGIMHFFFTVGPKTVILIMAVEMFPTVYRGTFYGIAAAVGKIGAIIIRGIIGHTKNGEKALGLRLVGFIPLMLFAAALSLLLPDVQHVPQVPDAEEARGEQGADVTSDVLSSHSSELEDHRRGVRVPGWRGIIQRLDNKTLEEIAPNPLPIMDNESSEK